MTALGRKQPLISLAAQWQLSTKSDRTEEDDLPALERYSYLYTDPNLPDGIFATWPESRGA